MKDNPLFKEFESALIEARVAIKIAKGIINDVVDDDIQAPSNAYQLLPEVELALEDVKKSVLQDISRYVPNNEPEPGNNRYCFSNLYEEEFQEDASNDNQARFFNFLIDKLKLALHRPIESSDIIEKHLFAELSHDQKYLYMIIAKEIDGIESISFMQKLKRILRSVGEQRIEEAVILSRNAKKDEPHNNTISFILSQILYFKACHNHAECLPEAREEAKRACTYVESLNEKKLLRYRYHSIATERHFSPEKALDIMREYYMTNPESLTGKEGISANYFYNLRCWIILGTIPTNMWRIFEAESLKEITTKAIGGSLIYIYYLRKSVLEEINQGSDLFKEQFTDIEQLLSVFYNNYNHAKNIIDSQFDTKFTIKNSPPYLWITSHRCIQYFLSIAPVPSSDEILMHCSLDAHLCETKSYPEVNMVRIGLENTDYWRSWAISLTPFLSNRRSELIPLQRLAESKTLFPIYNDLLSKLEKLEREFVNIDEWEELEPFMPLYAYENLLEIGNSGPNTQLLRTKEDAPFLSYYRKWRKEATPNPVPSEIIKRHALSASFINFKEVHVFFEGVYRVFSSPQYNLEQHLENAKQAYNIQNNINTKKPMGEHISSLWWLYFMVLPMIVVTLFIFISNNDPASAFRTLVTILGGVVLLGAIFLMMLPNKK